MMAATMWHRYQPARQLGPSQLGAGVRNGSPVSSSCAYRMAVSPGASRSSFRPPCRGGASATPEAVNSRQLQNSRSAKDLRGPASNIATPPSEGVVGRVAVGAPGQTGPGFGGGLGARSTPDLRTGAAHPPPRVGQSAAENAGTPGTPSPPPGHVPFMASAVAAARAGTSSAVPGAGQAGTMCQPSPNMAAGPAGRDPRRNSPPPAGTASSSNLRRGEVSSPLLASGGAGRAGLSPSGASVGVTAAAAAAVAALGSSRPGEEGLSTRASGGGGQVSGRSPCSGLPSSVRRPGSGSPSPHTTQGKFSGEVATPNQSLSQREREDQLVWLREKVRLSENWARRCIPTPSEGDVGDAGKKRLFEDNARIQRQHVEMQEELRSITGQHGEEPTARPRVGQRALAGVSTAQDPVPTVVQPGPTLAEGATRAAVEDSFASQAVSGALLEITPRSIASRVVQLQRHLAEQDQEKRSSEEAFKAEIAHLQHQLDRVKQQQREATDSELAELQAKLGVHAGMLGNHSTHMQLMQICASSKRENERLEEELRTEKANSAQFREQLQRGRAEWRQEREKWQDDQRRRDKVEEILRKQAAEVQARLDLALANATEREKERRQLRSPSHHPSSGEVLTREQEVIQLRRQVKQLEQEKMAGERGEPVRQLSRQVSTRRGFGAPLEERSHGAGRGRGRSISAACGGRGTAGRRGNGNSLAVAPGGSNNSSSNNSYAGGSVAGSAAGRFGSPVPPVPLARIAAESELDSGLLESSNALAHSRSSSSRSVSSYSGSSTGSSSVATATRSNLCAVFGDAPLVKMPGVGWYFRLRINSTNTGWVGGFGIGVTLSSCQTLSTLPDRAARVPRSWLAGYWGRTFSDGHELSSNWKPQTLRPMDEVGFLVNLEGECSVFVNDEERCRFGNPSVPVKAAVEPELTALIDVSAAATSVTFLNGAPPPPSAKRGARSARAAAASAVAIGSNQGPQPPPPSPRAATVARLGGQHNPKVPTSPPVPPLQLRAGLAAAAAAEAAACQAAQQEAKVQQEPSQITQITGPPQVAVLPPPAMQAPGPLSQAISGVAAAAAAVRRVPQLALHSLANR
eukprot:TRINITY_DN43930_c0_g1_i1.p1 TRINITY_DN43930_c0_g1~~TRINITY_DN43930_c0_g1_i1.p1  ORF type:complete len:1085 (-),score=214.12 TRINITY_DN43930_c0_g1_i1:122-3376(-)